MMIKGLLCTRVAGIGRLSAGEKMAMKPFVKRVFTIFATNALRSPHLHDVSFEGPLTCWMSVLRVPSLAGCQFLEGPLTCLDVMWSLFWSKLDLKMKI